MPRTNLLRVLAVTAIGAVLPASPAGAQSSLDFYSGRPITILVASGEGGAYSGYAQLASEYMRRYIPGKPAIIVQHMPGAGGIRAADYLHNVAAKDGTVLGILLDLAVATQMLRPKSVKYDLSKFSVIGSIVTDNPVLMVRADSGVTKFADLETRQIVVGASGNGSQTYTVPTLLNEVLGARIKIVPGYRGSSDISLALERGEVQGQSATWVSWKSGHADWIKDKKIVPIIQSGLQKEVELPDVPLMMELAKSKDDRQVLALMSSGSQLGRFLSVPPGVPADRVAALRHAFDAMLEDAEFVAAAAKRRLEIKPMPGPAVQAIIREVVSYPPAVISRARDVIGVKE
jgi:tripartite-type tricarboxylate transporter receptor subunit TctC